MKLTVETPIYSDSYALERRKRQLKRALTKLTEDMGKRIAHEYTALTQQEALRESARLVKLCIWEMEKL